MRLSIRNTSEIDMAFTGAVVLTGVSIHEQEKRADRVEKAQKRASEVEGAIRANEARKARREQVREARVRRAEVENVSATSGQTGSSAAIAAGDSLQARLGTNVGNINEALLTGTAKSKAEQSILDANRKSGLELASGAGIQIASLAK